MVHEPPIIGRGPVPILERKQMIRKGVGTPRQGRSHWRNLCRLCRWAPRPRAVACEGTVSCGLSPSREVCPLDQMSITGPGPIPWGHSVGWRSPVEPGEQVWEAGAWWDEGSSHARRVGAGTCMEGSAWGPEALPEKLVRMGGCCPPRSCRHEHTPVLRGTPQAPEGWCGGDRPHH